jgi:predicted HicB family RNase H-like nuclease
MTKNINITIPAELHHLLKVEAAKAKMTLKDYIIAKLKT